MGTDPWADDQWDSEPDLPQVPLPIALLDCYPTTDVVAVAVNLSKEETPISESGFIFPVDRLAWKSWEEEHISPDPVFYCRQLELVILATISVGTFSCQGSVLVDTGCRIPLLFRKGLIPEEHL